MKNIGILYQPQRSDSAQLAQKVSHILQERDIKIWQGAAHDYAGLEKAAPGLDLLITLGGDGTIVSASRAVAQHGVPVLGINLGRLGFLAEVEPNEVHKAIEAVLEGQYTIEERLMLRAELWRDHKIILNAEAINDIVLGRGAAARTVRVAVEVDSHYVMTQTADGIIVSTPTGSTAYCLAAGGPIVAPDLPCMVIMPIAAHLTLAHAIVVPARRYIRLKLIKGQGAMLTIDGQLDSELRVGDEVLTRASEYTAKFVRFGGDGYFYETILRRLRWPDQGQAL